MPKPRVSSSTCSSSSMSRKPWPVGEPVVGSASRYLRRGVLRGLEGVLGAGAADDDRQVVRRAGRRAERRAASRPGSVIIRVRVQDGLGLLVQEGLVRAAAALGHEQELVRVGGRRGRVDLDLRGQVGAGVLLVPHGQRGQLRVAQVEAGVGVVDAAADGLPVVAAGEDPLAPLAHHDRRAGVLAHRQHAGRGDVGVPQQVERDEPVVAAALGVVDDRRSWARCAGRRKWAMSCIASSVSRVQRLGVHPQEPLAAGLERLDALGR